MLAEFALTPSLFDPEAHSDVEEWREQLRELGINMFPKLSVWPVIISNLHGGSWYEVIFQMIQSIEDDRARRLCQGILSNAKQMLVPRPAVLDWPDDDAAWAREAISSHCVEPIDRIVTTDCVHQSLCDRCRAVRSISEVMQAGFWKGISFDDSPPMIIEKQVAAVRRLCIHAQFFAVISPHIYGGEDDESDFALELAKLAIRPAEGYPKADFEIHIEGPDGNASSADFGKRLEKRIDVMARKIRAVLLPGERTCLVVWPKLLDRLIIAGFNVGAGSGKSRRSPRWGIAMSHIARRSDETKYADSVTEWKLLKPKSLGQWFSRYCEETAEGWLARRVIAR